MYKDIDLRGLGDLLAKSSLARGYAKSMYSNLREQSLRPDRFHDQRAECLKAKVSRWWSSVVINSMNVASRGLMQRELGCAFG